jgi:glutathione S-transferase
MLRWMFWEQYNHEPNIATLRFWMRFVGLDALTDPSGCRSRQARGGQGGARADGQASGGPRNGSSADAISLADICLFAYTHVADEANSTSKPIRGS